MPPPIAIRTAPTLSDYTPLSEYQSRTPETFFGGQPILHAHAEAVKAFIPACDRARLAPVFPASSPTAAQDGALEQEVDLFVGSDFLTLFNNTPEAGIQIPYQCIALHAVKNIPIPSSDKTIPAIYMQLQLSSADTGTADDDDDDEGDFDTVELTLVLPTGAKPQETKEQAGETAVTAQSIFTSISDCSNLHPDPSYPGQGDGDDDDDRVFLEGDIEGEWPSGISRPPQGWGSLFPDGMPNIASGEGGGSDLPPPMPGSGGWITAENVHLYFDKDGQALGDGGGVTVLGEGAGRVRTRDEGEAEEGGEGGTGSGQKDGGDGEVKRVRVE